MKPEFDKYVNPETVIWQKIETEYWINKLKNLLIEHFKETDSYLSKKIIDNFDNEVVNFVQVCPREMINKLSHPLSSNLKILKAI